MIMNQKLSPSAEPTDPIDKGQQESINDGGEKDLQNDSPKTERGFGAREIFNIGHWGCLVYLSLLGVVAVATVIGIAIHLFDGSDELGAPIFAWIIAILLLLAAVAALGWTRIFKRE